MTQTKLYSFKLPIDLIDAVKAKAGKVSMTDVVTVALSDYVAGGSAGAPDPRVPELQAEVQRLRALSVKTTIDAVATKRAPQHSHHQSGPIYEPTGLKVQGNAPSMFKKSAKTAN
jgi:hypothetical protein